MKSRIRVRLGSRVGVVLIALASSPLGAGTLAPPPGPIAPSMKTLEEIEPRTIINQTNTPSDGTASFVISQPGSYYLVGNLTGEIGKDGIRIDSSDVTIDLNGHWLLGVAGTTHGIAAPVAVDRIRIANGTIAFFDGSGILMNGGMNHQLRDLAVQNCDGDGITLGEQASVARCHARENVGHGIQVGPASVLRQCTAWQNGGDGLATSQEGVVANCRSDENMGRGIVAGDANVVDRCKAHENDQEGIQTGSLGIVGSSMSLENSGPGIFAGSHSRIYDCLARLNTEFGISAGDQSHIDRCISNFNLGDPSTLFAGIRVNSRSWIRQCRAMANTSGGLDGGDVVTSGSINWVDQVTTSTNRTCFQIDGSFNLITRSAALRCPTPFDIAPAMNNRAGTIRTSPTVTDPWDNASTN